jgi:plasmid maintenance system antidote protein VapI
MGIDEQIRRIIRKRGVSGYAIAKAIEVQESVVYRFLKGADISAATLAKIAKHLGLTIKE